MALRVFISHGSGRDECVQDALQLLIPELKRRGYRVFFDVESLRVGDVWAEELYTELFACDAAVVLLGPQTLQDPEWVRRETEVLVSRHVMKNLPHVLPGLMGGLDPAQARSVGFAPLFRLQARIQDRHDPYNPPPNGGSSVAQFVDWMLEEFAHVGEVVHDEQVSEWAERIAVYLDKASRRNAARVLTAAKRLGLHDSDLRQITARIGSDLLLAFRLLSAAREGEVLAQAIGELQSVLDASLAGLIHELLPGWADQEAAECFLPSRGSDASAEGKVIVFPAHLAWMAEHHVQRALCMKPESWRISALSEESDLPWAGESPTERLHDACLEQLLDLFRVPPWKSLADVEEIPGVLPYLVVSLEDYSLETIAEVVRSLLREFEGLKVLNVVVLAPVDVPEPKELEVCGLADAVVVHPRPSDAEQSRAYRLHRAMDGLLKQCG
ncbi:toll/interleukin-1 receptor domain-containing protein [Streptomyces kunmingensis]|uniref:Toll/interleukin-1 receptor domain-containing protein n=1 Tax=Streptomyces kunmingensis TaxID=68225 RepID=A0ABU6CDC0_9ACTN|nr:toll/interleukin-1 receptor domain-containing protein [Streptomyces kunmingensis]MEB3962147.1 toll/interleukin-1 receptor domain-containing protein [Streptomyces kunmingensis]